MYRILFVCLGNICRSSAAEEIMRVKLAAKGLDSQVHVDSAGLIDYHEGELSDSRMIQHASQRGYRLTHRSRPITSEDYERFDMIIGMDDSNVSRLRQLSPTKAAFRKIHKITAFSQMYDIDKVPDPYYSGDAAFEYVLDLLEDACEGLVDSLEII